MSKLAMKAVMTRLSLSAAAFAAVAVATPAYSAVVIRSGPSVVQPPENVMLDTDINLGDNILRGTTNQTRSTVLFTGSDTLLSAPQGQARIEDPDGTVDSLVFSLENGSTFTSAEFNILASTSGTVTLTALNSAGSILNTPTTFDLSANGQNFFGVLADASTPISSIRIAPGTATISSIGQFRLGGVMTAAVPEPSTWAMMLFGFGAVGYSMRSRRRSYKLTQAI